MAATSRPRSAGPGKGSEFTVRLPAARRPTTPGVTLAGSSARESRKARILVVDDNVDTAQGMVRLLTLIGHEATSAHDGHEAARRRAGVSA